jgi:hypothetical protein
VIALANPALLWTGLALASVPILIHLFFRRRHRVVRWAAMEWLLAALRKQKRRMQMENLILLLMRIAVIVLLGLAIARPAVQSAALSPLAGGSRALVLVIDTSASMGAQQTGRRALERARERGDEVLADLPADSKVTLVATRDDQIGGAPRALLENAAPSEARTRLQSLQRSAGPNRLGAVFRHVGQKLDRLSGRKMVVFITDLQRRDWRDDTGARREDVYRALRGLRRSQDEEAPPVTLLDVGVGAGNVAIADFSVEEGRQAFVGTPVGLAVRLANYGPRPVEGTLSLFLTRADGQRENRGGDRVTIPPTTGELGPQYANVQMYEFLPAGSEGPARFEVRFQVSGGQDRLPEDSERFLALNVKPPVRFLPVRYVDSSLEILRDVGMVKVINLWESIVPAALATRSLSDTDVVVWADAQPFDVDFEDKGLKNLERFVRRGGGVVFYLGTESVADRMNRLFHREGGKGLFPMLLDEIANVEANPVQVDLAKATKGGSPLFIESEFALSPLIESYYRVKECPEESIAARYTNDDPYVIDHKFGRGRVVIVTTSPSETWFTMNGSLLPAVLLFNAAHYLVAEDPSARNVVAGQPVRVDLPAGARQVIVEPPEGAGGRTEEPVGNPEEPFVLTATQRPGFYRIAVKGVASGVASSVPTEEVHFAAVNLDAAEGDLRRDLKVADAYQGVRLRRVESIEDILPAASEGEDKGEISRALLGGVVVLLLLELLLAWRFGARRRPD